LRVVALFERVYAPETERISLSGEGLNACTQPPRALHAPQDAGWIPASLLDKAIGDMVA